MPSYETYRAHMAEAHPDRPVMSKSAFFRDRQQARITWAGSEGNSPDCASVGRRVLRVERHRQFPEQHRQLGLLVVVQRAEHAADQLLPQRFGLAQHAPARFGDRDMLDATIVGMRSPDDEAVALQPVDRLGYRARRLIEEIRDVRRAGWAAPVEEQQQFRACQRCTLLREAFVHHPVHAQEQAEQVGGEVFGACHI
ncbi:hypothetical protein WR25_12719 [Diploscapter pachys]|uniref:Uncharacterized protein n=1 Tax=Diploscapter pachys TaxID=2018661 RepID=A0A2A2K9T0_9BILA|nr:hypothetical protein WR25_12719 [Diploscapter pachys]